MKPILIIHGGAGAKHLSRSRHQEYVDSLRMILAHIYPLLLRGGSALHAVVSAVSALEDDPLYNAGKGSKIQSDGHIRMSASVMDGSQRRFAGCVNVEGVKNPVRLAAALLKRQDRVLSGDGARRFAREMGLQFASPFTDEQKRIFALRKRGKTGTVGAVALDKNGRLAAATSTGGKGFEYPFRVSDSPTSAGNFANKDCAVSATGIGEEIVEFAVASTICANVSTGEPLEKSVRRLLHEAELREAQFGLIGLSRKGQSSATTTTANLLWAEANSTGFSFMPLRVKSR